MKRFKFWYIPALFFIVACALNLAGCLTEGELERIMKPSLMPLLCVATLAYLLESASAEGLAAGPEGQARARRGAVLLTAGQLFGFAGDTMLMGKGFVFFAGGIALFLIGHLFYISLIGGESWKGLGPGRWALAAGGMLAACCGLVLGIGVNGAMLAPMGIYSLVLTVLIFSALAGVLRPEKRLSGSNSTWWILLCGAVLFTFSDALIAVRNFGELSPFMSGFGVMSTYLLAQSLLAVGGARLILRK